MKLRIARETLLQGLEAVAKIAPRNSSLPILSSLQIVAEEPEIEIIATDTEIERRVILVSAGGNFDIPEAGSAVLDAHKLLSLAKLAPAGCDIKISAGQGLRGSVRYGRSRFTMNSWPPDDFPVFPRRPDLSTIYQIAGGALQRALRTVAYAMAKGDVRYYLNGALLAVDGDQLRVVATDGYRVACTSIPAEHPRPSSSAEGLTGLIRAIIPRNTVTEISRQDQDAETTVTLYENAIDIVITPYSGNRIISKLIKGRYPDWQRVIPDEPDSYLRVSRHDMIASLRRLLVIGGGEFNAVQLVVTDQLLKLSLNGWEGETASEQIDIENPSGKSNEIAFSARYMTDLLKTLSSDQVQIAFTDHDKPAIWRDLNSHDTHVLSPVKI